MPIDTNQPFSSTPLLVKRQRLLRKRNSLKTFCNVGRIFKMPRPAKLNISGMDVSALIALRTQIHAALAKRRTVLETQLRQLGTSTDAVRVGRGRRGVSVLKGRKVAAKYRGPSGETWAGRGAKPRWLVAAMKESGKKLNEFLIEKTGGRKKRRAKK
jgi:DNA-binding protein H-NS